MKTVNRGQLLKKALAGKLVSVGSYSFDDMMGERRTEGGLPVRIMTEAKDWKSGYCNLTEWDFRTKSGTAYRQADGTVCLIIHSNRNVELREVS